MYNHYQTYTKEYLVKLLLEKDKELMRLNAYVDILRDELKEIKDKY